MAITSLDGYIAAPKQRLLFQKTATVTSVAAQFTGMIQVAGNPGAGVLNVGNTTNGIVPTDAIAGYPVINAFGGGATGYLTNVEFSNTVLSNLILFDCVYAIGALAHNVDVSPTSPSWAARNGGSYEGLEIWIEAVTAFTGNQSIQVNYTDQGGAAGDSGVIATGAAPIINRMFQVPLAAGDSGVQAITRIRSTVSSAGTFKLYVMRRLWANRCILANSLFKDDLLKTGMPIVYADSALVTVVQPDSTSSGSPRMVYEIANG
jgi:hypothetical protein